MYRYSQQYGALAHASDGASSDQAKLGRWMWARYQGNQGTFLCCVSIYCLCPCNTGAEPVASQHHQYFQSVDDDCNPCSAFLEDFETELWGWLVLGDHIIIGGDINQPILHHDIQELFAHNHMANVLASCHNQRNAPATFMYSQRGHQWTLGYSWHYSSMLQLSSPR